MKNKDGNLFLKTLMCLAIPIAIQSIISTSLNIVDSIMIGRLEETALAAVGLANQYFYVFILLIFGVASGVSIFVSQYWGIKDIKNIKRVLGLGLITALLLSTLFSVLAWLFPEKIIGIFIKDVEVIKLGSQYLRIVAFSYPITSLSLVYSAASRSIERTKEIMWASSISLLCNTAFNYILIFGKFGFEKFGVQGAAIATLLARIVELLIILRFVYGEKTPLAAKFKELFDFSYGYAIKIYNKIIFVILNESLWALGISIYTIAYGKIGTVAVAAIQICNIVQNLFMIVAKSLSTASAVMIGNKIGEGDTRLARDYANKFCKLGIFMGLISGMILILIAPYIVKFYNIKLETQIETIKTLQVIGLFLMVKVFNVIMTVGIFRSGGETEFAFVLDVGTVWFIGIPMAFIGALVFKWPIYLVVALISIEEVVKGIIGYHRIRKGKWIKSLI